MLREFSDILKIDSFPNPYDIVYTAHSELDFNEFCYQNRMKNTFCINAAKVIVIGDISVGKSSLINK